VQQRTDILPTGGVDKPSITSSSSILTATIRSSFADRRTSLKAANNRTVTILLAISDPAIAMRCGVVAIKLVHHYEFRAIEQSATSAVQGPVCGFSYEILPRERATRVR